MKRIEKNQGKIQYKSGFESIQHPNITCSISLTASRLHIFTY